MKMRTTTISKAFMEVAVVRFGTTCRMDEAVFTLWLLLVYDFVVRGRSVKPPGVQVLNCHWSKKIKRRKKKMKRKRRENETRRKAFDQRSSWAK